MTSKLERAFEVKVLEKLRPLPVAEMPRTIYKLLAAFDRRHIQPARTPEADITFGRLGFRESMAPLATFLPGTGWMPYPKDTRKENLVILPIRNLTASERALPALNSLLAAVAAPINPEMETLLMDIGHHFRSAAVNARTTSIGLGYATVAIPNACCRLSETAVFGQMLKIELVKF